MVDIKADDIAFRVQIDDKAFDLSRLGARYALQLDIGCPSPDNNAASWVGLGIRRLIQEPCNQFIDVWGDA
jgi:hypothetical protein